MANSPTRELSVSFQGLSLSSLSETESYKRYELSQFVVIDIFSIIFWMIIVPFVRESGYARLRLSGGPCVSAFVGMFLFKSDTPVVK